MKRFLLLAIIFFFQNALIACSGSSDSNKPVEVVSDFEFISSYVDKDLGARLTIDKSVSLYIPPKALPESQIITVRIFKNKTSYTNIVEFEPANLLFLKPLDLDVRMPFGLANELVEAYIFNDQGDVLDSRDEAPIAENIDFILENRWLKTEIIRFSPVAVFGSDLLSIVFQLPSQFLLPGDIEYNLSADNRWQTGHARMYLGFDIESSPMEVTLETGTQEFLNEDQKILGEDEIRSTSLIDFPYADTFIHSRSAGQGAVYIDSDSTFRDDRDQWLYLGAKRRSDMLWQSRIELAVSALQQEGKPYFPIGKVAEEGFSSTSLVEFVYQVIGFAIETFDNVNEVLVDDSVLSFINSPLPVLQIKSSSLEDINEITVYESGTDGLIIPVYGVSRAESEGLKSYSVVAVVASVEEGDEDLLANFDSETGELDLGFIYQKEDESPWEITFALELELNSKLYKKERSLTIYVEDARPVFRDNFLTLNVSDDWTSDSSQIDGSDGVVLNQLAGVLSITTPIPSSDCDSHFLWTPQLNLPGNFSVQYEFVKSGFGRSALLLTSDGLRDGGVNDNALEFFISTDAQPYLGIDGRLSGVNSNLYQISNEEYLNVLVKFQVDRIDNEFHFYINDVKVPEIFSNSALNADSTITLAIETSVCASDSGNAVDRLNSISVENGASIGFENLALSVNESSYGEDHNQVCMDEFGSAWSMADWTDLENYFSDEKDLDELVSQLGFADRTVAWILREGDPSLDVLKDYFVAYHNREKPDSFASYDDIDEDFFNLGAALTDKYVLCTNNL